MILDFEKLDAGKKYNVMSKTIFPRPIAWITTEDEGVVNLAPFSYFTPLSSEPPLVIVAVGKTKDTYANILKNRLCTINLADKNFMGDIINSAQSLPKELSECEEFGIQTQSVLEDFPPMAKGVGCALFCELYKTVEISEKSEPVILEIKHIYVADENIDENDSITLENLGRVGSEYLIDSTRVN